MLLFSRTPQEHQPKPYPVQKPYTPHLFSDSEALFLIRMFNPQNISPHFLSSGLLWDACPQGFQAQKYCCLKAVGKK